jgi:hypothetical protein
VRHVARLVEDLDQHLRGGGGQSEAHACE